MITAKPVSLFSWAYELSDADGIIATVHPGWFREKAQLEVRGESYEIRREGLMSGLFLLLRDGSEIAAAEKPNAFRRHFIIQTNDRIFQLEAESAFGRSFLLREAERVIGSVRPRHILSRSARVDFPEDIDLPIRVFLFVLVLFLWRRQASSSS